MAETCYPTSLHLHSPCYWSRAQRAVALRTLTLGSNVRIANGSSDPLHPVTSIKELVHCGVIPMRTKILIVLVRARRILNACFTCSAKYTCDRQWSQSVRDSARTQYTIGSQKRESLTHWRSGYICAFYLRIPTYGLSCPSLYCVPREANTRPNSEFDYISNPGRILRCSVCR